MSDCAHYIMIQRTFTVQQCLACVQLTQNEAAPCKPELVYYACMLRRASAAAAAIVDIILMIDIIIIWWGRSSNKPKQSSDGDSRALLGSACLQLTTEHFGIMLMIFLLVMAPAGGRRYKY